MIRAVGYGAGEVMMCNYDHFSSRMPHFSCALCFLGTGSYAGDWDIVDGSNVREGYAHDPRKCLFLMRRNITNDLVLFPPL